MKMFIYGFKVVVKLFFMKNCWNSIRGGGLLQQMKMFIYEFKVNFKLVCAGGASGGNANFHLWVSSFFSLFQLSWRLCFQVSINETHKKEMIVFLIWPINDIKYNSRKPPLSETQFKKQFIFFVWNANDCISFYVVQMKCVSVSGKISTGCVSVSAQISQLTGALVSPPLSYPRIVSWGLQ